MQTVKNRLTTTAIMVCALIAIAFGGVAFAAGNWWPSDSNTLTVMAIKDSNLAKDVAAGTTVEVDVYKIASAEQDETYETFNYTLEDAFTGLNIEGAQNGTVAWDYIEDKDTASIAREALDAVGKFEVDKTTMTLVAGSDDEDKATATADFSGLDHGLYLVVPHGNGEEPLVASGKYYKYAFLPSVVALPTKLSANYDEMGYLDPDATIKTSDAGSWSDKVTIALKVTEKPLYGSLKIVKKVTEFAGSPFTCKFRIESTEDSPWVYQNTAAVTVSSADGGEVVIDQIPAGAIVTVEEVYAGAGYEFVSSDCDGKEFTIPSDAAVKAGEILPTATFTNKPNNGTEGHGVQNKFVQENGEWHLKDATSAEDAVIETESPK